jgi:acetylornithine deacetylase/succinyl-diaminopimelate desuccinylase-like protein
MQSRVVELLCDLIALPSVNPDGAPPSAVTGEAACARYVGDFCAQLGAAVRYDEVLPGRPNVIAQFPTDGTGKKRILLAPHTDTVTVDGMTIEPFSPVVREGRVWGRGACDTKGTMAAMLAALESFGPSGIASLGAEVTFVGFMGEETGQWGSRHFAEKYRGQYDFAVIGEPTECATVHTHKGSWWVRLHTRGIAVHGSQPERGENAVLKMMPVLAALDAEFRLHIADPQYAHPVLGGSTLNIGMIRGGTRTNIVPDHCTVWLDFRFTPALHRAGLPALLTAFLREHGMDGLVEVEGDPVCPPLDTDPDHPLVAACAAAGTGRAGATWFCDAVWLSEIGHIPAVAAGPGSIAQAHTKDEWVAIDQLVAGVAFYRRFLASLA